MDFIETADGKQHSVTSVSQISNPEQLYVRITGEGLPDVATEFSNPRNTQKIKYNDFEFLNYTKMIAIVPEGDCIRIVLGRL